ncbi:COG3650 family protein [Phenylobacterium sp.]|jgi:uncharacterized membrane protein|uniref:COG3650 family protein n=1 Tax=Phenylobacterium sp. TaxID=1871053 RepID=UPI0037848E34
MRNRVWALALLLAACGREAETPAKTAAPPAPAAAPKPPGTVSDFSQPMIARGTEPFWAVKIDGTRFTLSEPGQADVAFEAPGARISPGRADWTATGPDGRTLVVTLYVSECSDGMSDLRYPMTAEVETAGRTLRGCAAKASEAPREGG